jgi:hypothetical protein
MPPTTIARLVAAAGGAKPFAAAVGVGERHAYYLKAGKRRMSESVEKLARQLAESLGVELTDEL